MSHVIGYLEGTDPLWLTTLVAQGYDTIPVSNGYDNHGKNLRLYNEHNRDALVIGYLHKVITPAFSEATPADILHGCLTHHVPVLLACPQALQAGAATRLGGLAAKVQLVEPEQMVTAIERMMAQLQQAGSGAGK
jgi:hypothetical protein